MISSVHRRSFAAALFGFAASAAPVLEAVALDCTAIHTALADRVQELRCVDSPDLTTQNPDTTPLDNSRADLPPLAFTPRTDRAAISPDAPNRTPIAGPVPGLQITGAMADDAGARFLIRLPSSGFSGRLIAGVPGALRSEYTGDYVLSDFVLQRGDAYVMTNKGAYNVRLTTAADPKACALSPPGVPTASVFVRGYVEDPDSSIQEWWHRTIEASELARRAAAAVYGGRPTHTYLFGISAGGLTVRRILAKYPHGFDGGVDWEGLYITPLYPTVMREYPQAVAGFLDYRAEGYSSTGAGAAQIRDLGFAPDIFAQPPTPLNSNSPVLGSYWETAANAQWHLLGCLFIHAIDPTYTGAVADYDFDARRSASFSSAWELSAALARISTPGDIRRPMITVSGTIEQLAPIDNHARAFRRNVVLHGKSRLHRLYEVQNGGHIDRWRDSGFNFTQLEYVAPHAQRALELLEDWVEDGARPPRGQCIPRGGEIVAHPRTSDRPRHCEDLIAP